MDHKELYDTVLVLGLNYDARSADTSVYQQQMERSSSNIISLQPSLALSLYDDKYDVPKELATSPSMCSLAKVSQQQSPTQSTISSFFEDPLTAKTTENETRTDELGKIASQISCDQDEDANVRKKLRLTKEQSAFLEDKFKEQSTLSTKQKHALANQLNLRPRQVEVWFQNRRARTKLKQTQVDYEFLKKCCDSLRDENKRLQKELYELRALKRSSSSKLYMQLPKAAFTMCPSCERISPAPNHKVTMAPNKSRSFNPFGHPAAC